MVADLIIGPALFLGLIIGAYEIIVMHKDVTVPTHRFLHMLHALVFSVLFVFASINVDFVLSIIPALNDIPLLGNALILRIAIGFVAMIKIHLVSKVIPGTSNLNIKGVSETWFHSFVVGGLIVAAPYVYPFVKEAIPSWMNF